MSQLNTLLESAAGSWKNLQSDAARLSGKWGQTGLLEGMEGQSSNNMSMLLENQAKQLVVEASNTAGAAISDTNNFSGTGAQWAGVALPLVRKVFGQIAAQEFVSVQPMNLPSGLVFYLDFQYGDAKAPFASGDSLYGDASANFGNKAEGGLYGAGRYSYSINTHVSASTIDTASVSFQDVEYDSDYVVTGSLTKVVLTLPNIASVIDPLAVRSFTLSGSGVTQDLVLSQFTTYDSSISTLNFIVSASSGAVSEGAAELGYSQITSAVERGDFEDGNDYATDNDWDSSVTADISIPEINIQMKSEAIVAKTRKLKAVWTPEFAQDLNAYQSVDAEAEVTNMLSEYISLEIDLEILDMLIKDAAAGDEYWSAVNNRTISAGDSAADFGDAGFFNTQGQWFQTLGTKMQKLSNKIHQRTLRGGANFLVCSPTVATILESIPGFASNSDGDVSKGSYAFGVQKAGQMNSRYTVYKNPYMKENTILMGFRGSQFLEAGAVFAPYIPLIMTPLVYDPETFTPRKGLLTRYAKKMLRPEFYGRIFVNGLNTL